MPIFKHDSNDRFVGTFNGLDVYAYNEDDKVIGPGRLIRWGDEPCQNSTERIWMLRDAVIGGKDYRIQLEDGKVMPYCEYVMSDRCSDTTKTLVLSILSELK